MSDWEPYFDTAGSVIAYSRTDENGDDVNVVRGTRDLSGWWHAGVRYSSPTEAMEAADLAGSEG